ncbi:MAG: RnfABCDGE type electron transport complex subunit B [Clostridiales bacterium]|mgnify:FL=1|nr:RnfABCDGE type electron transport complex subunit B [Clostridiales bacterium]
MHIDIMNIVWAVVVLGAIGAVFGIVLAIASKVFSVGADSRGENILNILPGVNCGGCGFTGCALYAEAVSRGDVPVDLCAPGGRKTAEEIARLMGTDVPESDRMVAVVKCSGGTGALKRFEYDGIHDCRSADLVGGGPLECPSGCIGFGTCVEACPFDAIYLKDGRAVVDHEKCTGCLVCVEACPRKIITPFSYNKDVIIKCSSHERGAAVRRVCGAGCVGCSICKKECPSGAITIDGNLAAIDPEKCTDCGKCVSVCPRGLITHSRPQSGMNSGETM